MRRQPPPDEDLAPRGTDADPHGTGRTKPLYRAGGMDAKEAIRGDKLELEAKALISRMRALAAAAPPRTESGNQPGSPVPPTPTSQIPTTPLTPAVPTARPKPLSPEERTRLAELCLALLAKYPRQAARVGAVAVLWTGMRSALSDTERLFDRAADDLQTSPGETLFDDPSAPAWEYFRVAFAKFSDCSRDVAAKLTSMLAGLKPFANSADGRRLAFRARLCLGDVYRYEDRAIAKAYAVARQQAVRYNATVVRSPASPRPGAREVDPTDAILDFAKLPMRSDLMAVERLHRARDEYALARLLCPTHGQAYNSLAIVEQLGRRDPLQAAYAYVRAAVAPEKPFVAAVDTLHKMAADTRHLLPGPEDLQHGEISSELAEAGASAMLRRSTYDDSCPPDAAETSSQPTSPVSAAGAGSYALLAHAAVSVLSTSARGERASAFIAGDVLTLALNNTFAANQTSPAERLCTRLAIAAIFSNSVGNDARSKRAAVDAEHRARKQREREREMSLAAQASLRHVPRGALPELVNPSPDAASPTSASDVAAPALGRQAIAAVARSLAQAITTLPRSRGIRALTETDAAAGLSLLLAAPAPSGQVPGTMRPAQSTIDGETRQRLLEMIDAAAAALRFEVALGGAAAPDIGFDAQAAEASPSAAPAADGGESASDAAASGGRWVACALMPEDAECAGLPPTFLNSVASHLATVQAFGRRLEEDDQAGGRPATGGSPASATIPLSERAAFARHTSRGLSAPILSGAELAQRRLARLRALLKYGVDADAPGLAGGSMAAATTPGSFTGTAFSDRSPLEPTGTDVFSGDSTATPICSTAANSFDADRRPPGSSGRFSDASAAGAATAASVVAAAMDDEEGDEVVAAPETAFWFS